MKHNDVDDIVGMAQVLLRRDGADEIKPTEAQIMFAVDKISRLVNLQQYSEIKMAAHVELSRRYGRLT